MYQVIFNEKKQTHTSIFLTLSCLFIKIVTSDTCEVWWLNKVSHRDFHYCCYGVYMVLFTLSSTFKSWCVVAFESFTVTHGRVCDRNGRRGSNPVATYLVSGSCVSWFPQSLDFVLFVHKFTQLDFKSSVKWVIGFVWTATEDPPLNICNVLTALHRTLFLHTT